MTTPGAGRVLGWAIVVLVAALLGALWGWGIADSTPYVPPTPERWATLMPTYPVALLTNTPRPSPTVIPTPRPMKPVVLIVRVECPDVEAFQLLDFAAP